RRPNWQYDVTERGVAGEPSHEVDRGQVLGTPTSSAVACASDAPAPATYAKRSAAEAVVMRGELPASEARTDTGSPASNHPRPPFRLLRCCAAASWGCWLASIGLLWGQHQLRVVHPWSFVFLLLLAVTVLTALCGLACAVWRIARGPNRW